MPGKDEEEQQKILSRKFIERYRQNPRIWFGTYESGNSSDPRTQSEDLGDNSMTASEYGIKNLKRIVPNLLTWTREEADEYRNLAQMYSAVTSQFQRYLNHVARNVGGYYETYKTAEQDGVVFEATPRNMQKDAVAFLNRHIFQTPEWLADRNILNRINAPVSSQLGTIQDNLLSSLLSSSRLDRMIQLTNRFENGYPIEEFYADLKKGIFSELAGGRKIDNHRRNLQKSYVERMTSLLNPAPSSAPSSAGGFSISISFGPDVRKTDISSLTRAHLSALRTEINTAAASTADAMTKYHLQDLSDRIRKALDPK